MGQRRWFVRKYVGHSLRLITLPDNEHTGARAKARDSAGSGTGHAKTEWRVCPYCGNDARFNRRNATYSPHTSDDSGQQCRRPGR